MYIVVQHEIRDPQGFQEAGATLVTEAPDGLRAWQFYPSRDLGTAVCLWQAGSVDALKQYIEPRIAAYAKNTYFAVADEYAQGLPEPSTATQA